MSDFGCRMSGCAGPTSAPCAAGTTSPLSPDLENPLLHVGPELNKRILAHTSEEPYPNPAHGVRGVGFGVRTPGIRHEITSGDCGESRVRGHRPSVAAFREE